MKSILITVFILVFCPSNNHCQNSRFDHSLFDSLLKNYVDDQGLINYNSFKDNNDFNIYLESLGAAKLDGLSNNEKLAFYINAYNACVIKNVINHWQINSPMDVKGFFDQDKFTIAGERLTLNDIEYGKVFNIDPVLCHFGLVCAGKSCPKLLQKAYTGSSVRKQLEENAKVFLNDDYKNKLDRASKVLYLSEIFNWFEDKFTKRYGSLKAAAATFMNSSDSEFLRENEVIIKFIMYDWNLNKQ